MAILDEQHIGDTIQVKYRRREDVPEDSDELMKLKGESDVLNLLLVRLSFDDTASAELLLHAWRGEVQDVERCLKARACPDHRSEEDDKTSK
eukprot:g22881.t1